MRAKTAKKLLTKDKARIIAAIIPKPPQLLAPYFAVRTCAVTLVTRDEARRIAANIAKLPELLRKD